MYTRLIKYYMFICILFLPSLSLSSPRPTEDLYQIGCAMCHDTGVAGSPMLGNKSQWINRTKKGYKTLVNNSWNGINGMPAKGYCQDCTKKEIGLVVQYMLDSI